MKIPYHRHIGIDRSDAKIDVTTLNREGNALGHTQIPSQPEALQDWVHELQRHLGLDQRVAICIEQPCANLAAFFITFAFIDLYLVNPMTLKRWRETFNLSRAKDDKGDSRHLAELLFERGDHLTLWKPDDPITRKLRALTEKRRGLVDERTRLTNQLTAELKSYYPQALELCGKYLHSKLACDLLTRWPTLQDIQRARPETLRRFYYLHASRRPKVIDERLKLIEAAVCLTQDDAILQPGSALVIALVKQLNALRSQIDVFDSMIASAMTEHEDAFIFESLPGAGPNLSARLLATFGSDRERFENASGVQRHTGIAPVLKQSGNARWVQRRFACPVFLRQTLTEWSGQTVTKSQWARAYYQQQKEKGIRHHAILRALAYKWIRIIYRCWQNKTPYNEAQYLAALRKHASPLIARIEALPTPASPRQ
jgi:transposase